MHLSNLPFVFLVAVIPSASAYGRWSQYPRPTSYPGGWLGGWPQGSSSSSTTSATILPGDTVIGTNAGTAIGTGPIVPATVATGGNTLQTSGGSTFPPNGGSLYPTGGSHTGGEPTGGNPTGIEPTGGSPTGGSPTSVSSTGGSPTGGSPTGGSPTGGSPTGGSPTGGSPTGGSPTGGSPTGGSPTGGSPTGGSPTGGSPTGGSPTGGSPTGGSPTGGTSVPTGGTPPSSGSVKGMNYNAQAGYDWAGQFGIAKGFGFNSARLYTMIEPGTANSPIAALAAAAFSSTSVLLGIWLENNLTDELAALKSAMSISGLDVVGLACGNEDLLRNTNGGGGASAATITGCISQAKAIVGSKFPVGHVDIYGMWITADGKTVAESADFIGYNGYPYWEGKAPDSATLQAATSAGLADVEGLGKPIWITETGWPVSGSTVGSAVPSTQNAATFYQAVGCGMLFGKYNTWWYTLEDSALAAPHFGVTSGPGQSSPLYSLACS